MYETNEQTAVVLNIEIAPPRCNCVGHYRESIAQRRLLFQLYRERGTFSLGQLAGFVTWLWARPSLTSRDRRTEPIEGWLWDFWGQLRLRMEGRPPADKTLVLWVDAMLLCFSPNPYVHLLRDAFGLRLGEYRTRLERQMALANCVKWTEVTCRRVWLDVYGTEPSRPSKDWWLRTAHRQGLVG